jgi:hypothetical protein
MNYGVISQTLPSLSGGYGFGGWMHLGITERQFQSRRIRPKYTPSRKLSSDTNAVPYSRANRADFTFSLPLIAPPQGIRWYSVLACRNIGISESASLQIAKNS